MVGQQARVGWRRGELTLGGDVVNSHWAILIHGASDDMVKVCQVHRRLCWVLTHRVHQLLVVKGALKELQVAHLTGISHTGSPLAISYATNQPRLLKM